MLEVPLVGPDNPKGPEAIPQAKRYGPGDILLSGNVFKSVPGDFIHRITQPEYGIKQQVGGPALCPHDQICAGYCI